MLPRCCPLLQRQRQTGDRLPRQPFQYDSPSVEISLKVEYMAFSHNPNRLLVGNSGGVVTFNRVERILIDHNGVCGELVYIFCKGSDTVHCILLDRHYANRKGGDCSPPLCCPFSEIVFAMGTFVLFADFT